MTLRLGTTTRALDVEKAHQGVEKECPHRPGLYVTVLPAAAWNRRWKERVRQENEAVLARMRDGEKIEGRDFFEDAGFIADTLVGGMRGLYDADGNEVAYTPEIGVQVLEDEANADVKEWVVLQAQRYGQFYRDEVEKDEGN